MKSEILKILQMQQDGKLTQDQAAELLAMLADQARERDSSHAADPVIEPAAPGPQRDSSSSTASSNSSANSQNKSQSTSRGPASTLHDFVDAAVGVGATVGRAATVWGTEFINMVHREQAGNTITLSKVDPPTGADFTFSGNTINVSKVAHLTLNQAQVDNNSINASQVSHITITRGRLSQCQISGSSVSHIVLEGAPESNPIGITGTSTGAAIPGAVSSSAPADAAPNASTTPSALRGITFNASKFARIRLLSGSQIDACIIQASAVKDLELSNASTLRDSRISESSFTASQLDRATFRTLAIDRSSIQSLTAKDISLDRVTFAASRLTSVTLTGGRWANTRFRRDALGTGGGGKDSLLQESTFDNCTLTDCEFLGCTFRRTTLRNLTLQGLTIRNIDFTGLILDSEESFKKAAGL